MVLLGSRMERIAEQIGNDPGIFINEGAVNLTVLPNAYWDLVYLNDAFLVISQIKQPQVIKNPLVINFERVIILDAEGGNRTHNPQGNASLSRARLPIPPLRLIVD